MNEFLLLLFFIMQLVVFNFAEHKKRFRLTTENQIVTTNTIISEETFSEEQKRYLLIFFDPKTFKPLRSKNCSKQNFVAKLIERFFKFLTIKITNTEMNSRQPIP